MPDDDGTGMFWPRGLFESRRHARRRFEEFKARSNAKYEVITVGGERFAILRPECRPSKNGEQSSDQQ